MLQRKSLALPDSVVINLIKINFRRRIVYVVLVRRVTRPISTGRINFNDHKPIRRERRRDHVNDLPRRVSSAAQTADRLARRNQSGRQTRVRRRPALCNFASRLRGEDRPISRRQIQRIRKSIKHILPFPNFLSTAAPIGLASSTQKHKRRFLMVGPRSQNLARLQTVNVKTHPFPSRQLPGQRQQHPSYPLC